jgi:hypothetical protein
MKLDADGLSKRALNCIRTDLRALNSKSAMASAIKNGRLVHNRIHASLDGQRIRNCGLRTFKEIAMWAGISMQNVKPTDAVKSSLLSEIAYHENKIAVLRSKIAALPAMDKHATSS